MGDKLSAHLNPKKAVCARPMPILACEAARLDLEDVKGIQQLVREHLQRVLYQPPARQWQELYALCAEC